MEAVRAVAGAGDADRAGPYLVGLTGGIGSGKSTVAAKLATLGAQIIDADLAAREVVAVGEPALAEIRARFGDVVIAADGSLDRPALATIVFADDAARSDLEAITHPAIARRIQQQLADLENLPEPAIVVIDHPLLVETGQADRYPAVIVVTAPVAVRVSRLADDRGIDAADALARIAAQADDAERRAAATHVIDNSGDFEQLRARVAEVFDDLVSRAVPPAR